MDDNSEILNEDEIKKIVDEEVAHRMGKPNRAERRAFRKKHHQEIDIVYENARKLIYTEMIQKLREKNKEYEAAEDRNTNLQDGQ